MTNVKLVDTLMDPSVKLVPNQEKPYYDPRRHKTLVGKLNYFIATHPNITFTLQVVSQFLNPPCQDNWDAIINILRKSHINNDKGNTQIVRSSKTN